MRGLRLKVSAIYRLIVCKKFSLMTENWFVIYEFDDKSAKTQVVILQKMINKAHLDKQMDDAVKIVNDIIKT